MGKTLAFIKRNWKKLLLVVPVLLTLGLLLRRYALAQQWRAAAEKLRKLEGDSIERRRLITEKNDRERTRLAKVYEAKREALAVEAKKRELVLDADREAFAEHVNELWGL
jgi:hypothetical protein